MTELRIQKRPTGVTLIAAYLALYGIFATIVGLAATLADGAVERITIPGTGIIDLFIAYGLFTLRPWGRVLAIAFSAIVLVASIIALDIFGIGISAGIILYLSTTIAKNAFETI